MEPKRTLVTAALPYANGPVHIGHLAGCYLPADIYVRYLRATGHDVKFICGSDEHGVPITIKARQLQISPQDVVDKYHLMMKNSFAAFGISFDHYSRTSAPVHHQTAQDFFRVLHDQHVFTEETTAQFYDEEAKQFLADRYITGTCPRCGNENAYGDQCENCGSSLNPTDLIHPKSKLSGATPVLKPTKNWFLPLDRFQEKISNWIGSHQGDWKANVYGQCMSWLQQGLQPRAMTRDLDWGVKVPLPGTEGKVLYVWFDAPIGYISATREYFAGQGKEDEWKKYWQDQDSRLIHFIGKDNIVFHCIIFPAMLMAHGDYILPENVPANEFLNLEGDKISTSRNWAVWLHEYLGELKDKQDVLRYVLTATAPETKDNDFTWKDFQARNNNELVAILGNFINRTLVLTHKFFAGKIPVSGELAEADRECLSSLPQFKEAISQSLDKFRFREALAELMNLARMGNKYLADQEPWKLIKTDEGRTATILFVANEITAWLAVLSEPFLPFTAGKICSMINMKQKKWNSDLSAPLLPAGHLLGEASLLFEKIEDEVVEKQVRKLTEARQLIDQLKAGEAGERTPPPFKPETTFDEFSRMDLRVGTILQAERVPKTDKLLKLLLDTGLDQRTVVSGIAACYEPEKIIGQQVVLLANLAPRKIKGIESKGMILMAEEEDGKLVFVTPSEAVKAGRGIS